MKQKEASLLLASAMMSAIMDNPAMPAAPEMLAKLVTAAILDASAGSEVSEQTHRRTRTHRNPGADQELLPFAEREYIDAQRAARILGVTDTTMRLLHKMGLIRAVDYAEHKRKRVLYRSIVEFCDALRTKYSIRDRRPPLPGPMFRHRDADLLPFPLEDTIGIPEAAAALGYSSVTPVRDMIEEGRFEAYQFFSVSPWRISRTSLAAYISKSQTTAQPGQTTRVSLPN